ncbi:MAG TPA: hypothetical protein VF155_06240 [Candidatus Dormibacteraeota bacterium]
MGDHVVDICGEPVERRRFVTEVVGLNREAHTAPFVLRSTSPANEVAAPIRREVYGRVPLTSCDAAEGKPFVRRWSA